MKLTPAQRSLRAAERKILRRTVYLYALNYGRAQMKADREGIVESVRALDALSAPQKEKPLAFKQGEYVRVVSGPLTGANGPIDFLDPKGGRALVNFGEGRRGGLTWVDLDCLAGRGLGLWG